MRDYAFVIVALVCAYGVVGTIDAQVAEASEKERQQRTREDRARIFSKKCELKGMDTAASKSDNKPWVLKCVPRRVLGVQT